MTNSTQLTKNHFTKFLLYNSTEGSVNVEVFLCDDTIWLTQKNLSSLFGVTIPTINEHLKNIFKTNELDENSVIRNFLITASDGKNYNTNFYNLDAIISVGYRVNSKHATQFRIWATQTLKQHITEGFTINQSRIEQNHKAFLQAVEDIKLLAKPNIPTKDILELITAFSPTWFALDSYDKNTFPKKGLNKDIQVTAQDLQTDLQKLKQKLIAKNEATALFAQEKKLGNLQGIIGNVFQTVFGEDAYPTIEQKAAHLLYFIIKNHPFNDGNKRSGAFAFIWFLQKAGFDFEENINPETLATLTILIAESNPKDKEKMIGIVLLLITKK